MLPTSSTWSGSIGGSTTKPDSEFGFLSLSSDASAGSGPDGGLILSLDGTVVAARIETKKNIKLFYRLS